VSLHTGTLAPKSFPRLRLPAMQRSFVFSSDDCNQRCTVFICETSIRSETVRRSAEERLGFNGHSESRYARSARRKDRAALSHRSPVLTLQGTLSELIKPRGYRQVAIKLRCQDHDLGNGVKMLLRSQYLHKKPRSSTRHLPGTPQSRTELSRAQPVHDVSAPKLRDYGAECRDPLQ
jgi:hypothetical protein